MTSRRPRRLAFQAASLSAAAIALAIAACETPRPTAPRPQANVPLAKITAASPDVAPASRVDEATVRAALRRAHAEVLASKTGRQQRVWFVVDSAGAVVQSAWDRGGQETVPDLNAIDPNAIASVEVLKMPAGRIAPDSVAVIWVALKSGGAGLAVGGVAVPAGSPMRVRDAAPTTAGAVAEGAAPLRVAAPGAPAPLYVLDGREITSAEMQALDPNTIASIDVVKGAGATAEYGARGANGVVRITRKADAKPRRDR